MLRLRLQRPERLNALTLSLARDLLAAIERANADDSVRVVLLCGEGRAFCAGKDRDDAATGEFVDVLQRVAAALMDSPKPVVGAAQGWAVGAGLELLLNCDIVVAARNAQFKLPEVASGLFVTGGAAALLPRAIGLPRAKGVLMLGEPFTAEQALAWGLVWEVVDDARLEARSLAIATHLALGDRGILADAKRLLHRESIGELDGVLQREAVVHAVLMRKLVL
ncbi:MAG TPA: enoyl-CoA hydratase/isomerase family protein [Ramlibacter sp.]|uniref:enoyl-CoA hydratase/isomerase family protein n=1 Tax=Ramlibacter sp. TaxID=1917967 RepID=UPI002B8D043F|nr:enoyl-CoA hydratase/isomerase family protein [Ramlibacter sp.]HVZ46975.1 enoyl-CoA hydratase/isomerase family protein [Ramlibacter sp.]